MDVVMKTMPHTWSRKLFTSYVSQKSTLQTPTDVKVVTCFQKSHTFLGKSYFLS